MRRILVLSLLLVAWHFNPSHAPAQPSAAAAAKTTTAPAATQAAPAATAPAVRDAMLGGGWVTRQPTTKTKAQRPRPNDQSRSIREFEPRTGWGAVLRPVMR